MASVRSENVVISRPEDGSLLDLGPSIQVPEPAALAEVADQVYETVLHEEVCHLLDLRDTCLIEVHIQVTKEDPNDGGIKDARDEDGNINISDSTLHSLFPPQFK